mgnify:FL=1|jgi:hypothetical protein
MNVGLVDAMVLAGILAAIPPPGSTSRPAWVYASRPWVTVG